MVRFGGVSDGNEVHLFFDGDDAFRAMFAAVEQAERRVWVETYILEDDRIGRGLLERLVNARARGVDVRLLYDEFGSNQLPASFFDVLANAGGKVCAFNPFDVFPRFSFAGWARKRGVRRGKQLGTALVRDHRKLLIVDESIAFTGGMNVSEDYAGSELGRATFRDTHARLEGPAAHDLADIFAEGWKMASGERLPALAQPSRPRRGHGEQRGALVQVLRSNVLLRRTQIQRSLRATVRRSVERCWLTTPYFVPPERLLRQLIRAARRGVDVRILTAGKSDVPLVRMASTYLYGRLLRRGVRIFELGERTLHAKTAAVDGVYSTVGSFNLDPWSFKRNLEVNVAIVDAGLSQELEGQFRQDLHSAEEILLESWERRPIYVRLVHWLAFQLARL